MLAAHALLAVAALAASAQSAPPVQSAVPSAPAPREPSAAPPGSQLSAEVKPFELRSGTHANPANEPRVVFDEVIRSPGAPWMRLEFGETSLPRGSRLELFSLSDGHRQTLDARALAAWGNRSAYFNGDALYVELVAGPQSDGVSFTTIHVIVGDSSEDCVGVCGVDSRVTTSNPAVGRLLWTGSDGRIYLGSAFLISPTNCHASAGHNCDDFFSDAMIQYNVPVSTTTGVPQHPGPEDQYMIEPAPMAYAWNASSPDSWANDWCVFHTAPNTETGLDAGRAQGSLYSPQAELLPEGHILEAVGYGCTTFGGFGNLAQKTGSGELHSMAGTGVRHSVDTTPGNSGGPLVDRTTGLAMGVATAASCPSGNNYGTTFQNQGFLDQVAACALGDVCVVILASSASEDPPGTRATFRAFRDRVLARAPVGRRYTDLYYRYTPEVLWSLATRPRLLRRSFELTRKWQPILAAWTERGSATIEEADLDEVEAFLAELGSHSGLELGSAIAGLRRDLGKSEVRDALGLSVRSLSPAVR